MSQEIVLAPQAGAIHQPAPRLRGIVLDTFDDMWRFADIVSQSGLAPKGLESPAKAFIALQCGAELGFSPMQSLQSIGVINGRPGPYGEAVPAVVRNSGICAELEEWFECGGEEVTGAPWLKLTDWPDDFTAVAVSRRSSSKKSRTTRFSVADAKRAGLWGKAGTWSQYPQRMLRFRAMTFNLRDEFPDVTRGFVSAEELADMPEVVSSGPALPDPGRRKAGATVTVQEVPADAPTVTFPSGKYAGKEPSDPEVSLKFLEKCEEHWGKPETAQPSDEIREAVRKEITRRKLAEATGPAPEVPATPAPVPAAEAPTRPAPEPTAQPATPGQRPYIAALCIAAQNAGLSMADADKPARIAAVNAYLATMPWKNPETGAAWQITSFSELKKVPADGLASAIQNGLVKWATIDPNASEEEDAGATEHFTGDAINRAFPEMPGHMRPRVARRVPRAPARDIPALVASLDPEEDDPFAGE